MSDSESSVNWEELKDAFRKFFDMMGYRLDEDRHVYCKCLAITDEEIKAAFRSMTSKPKAKLKAVVKDDKVRLERQ